MSRLNRFLVVLAAALLLGSAAITSALAQDVKASPTPAAGTGAGNDQTPPTPQNGQKPAPNKSKANTPDDVEVRIEPIIWVPTTDSTVSIGDPRFTGTKTFNGVVTPAEAISDLHFGLSGRIEGRDGRWGGFGEFLYFSLGAPATVKGIGGTLNDNLGMAQLSGFYRVTQGDIPVDFVAGMRLAGTSVNLDFSSAQFKVLGGQGFNVTRSDTVVDPVLGARVAFPLSKKMFFQIYGDYGGFGIGNNQQTWRGQGTFGMDMCENTRLLLGYCAINFSGSRGIGTSLVQTNTTFRGPVLGVSFKL